MSEEVKQPLPEDLVPEEQAQPAPEEQQPVEDLQQQLAKAGEEKGVDVKTTRQELYDAMHHI